jgi:hypothetical protein
MFHHVIPFEVIETLKFVKCKNFSKSKQEQKFFTLYKNYLPGNILMDGKIKAIICFLNILLYINLRLFLFYELYLL